MFNIYRATEVNVKLNVESAQKKLTFPVPAIGSKDFIGKDVGKQMERVAENVQYKELGFGHQLAEECPGQLADLYLNFIGSIRSS